MSQLERQPPRRRAAQAPPNAGAVSVRGVQTNPGSRLDRGIGERADLGTAQPTTLNRSQRLHLVRRALALKGYQATVRPREHREPIARMVPVEEHLDLDRFDLTAPSVALRKLGQPHAHQSALAEPTRPGRRWIRDSTRRAADRARDRRATSNEQPATSNQRRFVACSIACLDPSWPLARAQSDVAATVPASVGPVTRRTARMVGTHPGRSVSTPTTRRHHQPGNRCVRCRRHRGARPAWR